MMPETGFQLPMQLTLRLGPGIPAAGGEKAALDGVNSLGNDILESLISVSSWIYGTFLPT